MRRPRLVYLVTHPASARILLAGQLGYMRSQGFDVTVISGRGHELDEVQVQERVRTVEVAMSREISLRADLRSLAGVTRVLTQLRPDIVNASTPKAGLIGSIAAAAIGVPVRLYLLRGLRLETERGALRAVLAGTEWLASQSAHEVIAVSASLRDAYVGLGLVPQSKIRVLGEGSSNGIDTVRFAPTRELLDAATAVRRNLSIDPSAGVIGYVGRLVRDKGILELLEAFDSIRRGTRSVRLLLVSADFSDERTSDTIYDRISRTPGVVLVPRVADVRPYLLAMDVLGFPSHREGFPNVVLEAAALAVPVVAFDVTGVRDAVVDGRTGTLVASRDAASLARGLQAYLDDRDLRIVHGRSARARAERDFSRPVVWQRWADTYRAHLRSRGLPDAEPGA